MNDHDFSVTLNGFFLVRWKDPRLIIKNANFKENGDTLIPVDVSLVSISVVLRDVKCIELSTTKTKVKSFSLTVLLLWVRAG